MRWRESEAALRAYEMLTAVKRDSVAAHIAYANALMSKYVRMTLSTACDAGQVIEVGSRAVECLKRVVALSPERIEFYQPLCAMLEVTGRRQESLAVLEQWAKVQSALAEARQLDRLGLRFISTPGATGNIGGLGGLDMYVKAGLLGWSTPHTSVLLLPPGGRVSNPCFLNYWRRYVTFITDQETIERLAPIARYLEDPFHLLLNCNGKVLLTSSAAGMIQRQWHAESRPPVLTLSEMDYERGWRCLQSLGVPRDAWFVCLHVRESGFRSAKSAPDTYRNADVDSYTLAITSIVARGGWVIRMGDPTMKPLQPMRQVIDYAHSDVRSDWMDVFCGVQCRFFIGISSGLPAVPLAFGVPCILTNYIPTYTVGFSRQDIFIPKLCWSTQPGRFLTFSELMTAPVSTSSVQSLYDWFGLKVVDNTPEEINDVTLEMLGRLDGSLKYSEEDERLQERFNALTAKCGTLIGLDDFGINCRIGRDFLRKHASLLGSDEEMAARRHRPAWGQR